MARPKRTIQRKPSGIYQAVIWVDGKRHAKSLETRDEKVATKRAAQAVRELEEVATRGTQSKWHADEPVIEWQIPELPDGSNDYANAKPVQKTWAEVAANDDQIVPPKGTTWRDLINEAVRVRKQKRGEEYSQGWYDNMRFATQKAPFGPLAASPSLIRGFILGMEKEGLSARSIQLTCGNLSTLIKVSMKSALLEGKLAANPFNAVDYSTSVVKHIPTMLQADYEGLGELLPMLSRQQKLALLTQMFTGCRYSEIKRRGAADFDLAGGTFTIEHDPGSGKTTKNRASVRVVPIPPALCSELAGFDFKWPSIDSVNDKLKLVNKTLSSHSFRHGLVRLNRDLGGDADVVEAFVGHSLKGMKDVYGDGFSVDRFREVLTPVWYQLENWITPE